MNKYAGVVIVAGLTIVAFVVFSNKDASISTQSFTIESHDTLDGRSGEDAKNGTPPEVQYGISPISGLDCEHYSRRPFAVMLASDVETRPLSGIAEADLVLEMPVITGSITRLLAVYQCSSPEEIGSIRSARHDFIPLAMGLDAIFVHWGGSHFALSKLNQGLVDNINALVNPYGAFYRKPEIPKPHNGFTSIERLYEAAGKLGYRLTSEFVGYPHFENSKSQITNSKGTLEIGYPYPFNVKYEYDPEMNSYLGWRGNTKETDRLTAAQVEIKNVVIMRAKSRQIEGQYNDVDIEGSGETVVYRNGEEIKGHWEKSKDNPESKLTFYDMLGEEIPFIPGPIWIHVVEPYQEVRWVVGSE